MYILDQYGILTIPGFCCCDAWQHWKYWKDEQYYVAGESLRSQLKRLRIHPSTLVFFYSSDELPPVDVEKEYLRVFAEERWNNPVLASASGNLFICPRYLSIYSIHTNTYRTI